MRRGREPGALKAMMAQRGEQPMAFASVASLTQAYRVNGGLSQAEVVTKSAQALTALASAVIAQGGFVGHIKAYLSLEGGARAAISVVRTESQSKLSAFESEKPASTFEMAATAIVYGLEQSALTSLMHLELALAFAEPAFSQLAVEKPQLKPIVPFGQPQI